MGAAALAGLAVHDGQVSDAVAYEGQGILVQSGEDQLSSLPVFYRLTRLGIYDLGQEHIPPDMNAFLDIALGE